MKKTIFGLVLLTLFLSFSTVQAQVLQCTSAKVASSPARGDYGSPGAFAVTRQTIANPDPNVPGPTSVFVPSNASPTNKVPVVFFAHGFGGISYQFYENLLLQLSGNGYIVVFSPYTANLFTTHAIRYDQLWAGFQLAVQQYGNIMDLTKVGFAGHSYGAGATPEMARRGLAQGWGSNSIFMFIMAAWYNWGTNLSQIPARTKMVVQVYWDDGTNEHLISKNDIWDKLMQITERKWQVIRASSCFCALTAPHVLPVTDGLGQTDAALDAYDSWGVWRRLHALSVYTFSGSQSAKTVAFGDNSFMGRWRGMCGIRQILPLEATDAPVMNTTSNPTWRWANKCTVADPGAPCP
jgi:hypothetical protein